MTVPHVGRYRLFQRALAGPLWTCRVCRESFKKANLSKHLNTELTRASGYNPETGERCWESWRVLEIRLGYLLRVRRSRRNLRRARWEYAVRKAEEP